MGEKFETWEPPEITSSAEDFERQLCGMFGQEYPCAFEDVVGRPIADLSGDYVVAYQCSPKEYGTVIAQSRNDLMVSAGPCPETEPTISGFGLLIVALMALIVLCVGLR